MKTRTFEKLHIQTSLLGFGCMRLPTLKNGLIDEEQAEAMLDRAITSGVNYIDTAYPYHGGESETFVGKVLQKYPREHIFLATKLPVWKIGHPAEVLPIFQEQLTKLQVDYIDFYLLHALDEARWETLLEQGVLDILDRLKAEGKIRYLGFSFHDEYPVFEKIITSRAWDFCQIQYNYLDTELQAGNKGYALAEALAIPVIVMEPVKGGRLAHLPEDIGRFFRAYDPKLSLSSWALRWVASHKNVKVILSGMSTMDQVLDNLETFRHFKALNQEELNLVSKVTAIIKTRIKNGCTGCEYCMPCPHGVNIPQNFRIWNEWAVDHDHDQARRRYFTDLAAEARADMCQACGICEPQCPQTIRIIQDLMRVQEAMQAIQ